jgi:hypothetical protein
VCKTVMPARATPPAARRTWKSAATSAGIWQYELNNEAIVRAAPILRADLERSCASALATALPCTSHAPATVTALTALANTGDGDDLRRVIALAQYLKPSDADALSHITSQDPLFGFRALHALLAQRGRDATFRTWLAEAAGAEEMEGGARCRAATARLEAARAQLADDLVAGLRTDAHISGCASGCLI